MSSSDNAKCMVSVFNPYTRSLDRDGAERSQITKDKETNMKIARNEYLIDETVRHYKDLARYYRMGVNPPRSVLEQVYSKERERG